MKIELKNREAWLVRAFNKLTPIVTAAGYKVSPVYVSVGWPKGHRGKAQAIGQCWGRTASADKRGHVFISPVLTSPVEVLATLLHEMGHDVVGCEHSHKAPFAAFCKKVGLNKPWTATSPNDELKPMLMKIATSLGDYPHAKLVHLKPLVKPGSRLRLYECPECGLKARIARDGAQVMCVDDEAILEQKP